MTRVRIGLLVVSCALAVTSSGVPAQTGPTLADSFTEIPSTLIDPTYAPASVRLVDADLNGDGYQDLVALGGATVGSGNVPQPGRVYLGDGDGHFVPAPDELFPVDAFLTVTPAQLLFADFNADGRLDMFVGCHGWDTPPYPGEQNRLYLSRPDGGWTDATATLPQLTDMSVTAAAGDISGRGLIDIFVGNGPIGLAGISSYTLLNTGSGQFTRTTTNIPVGARACGNPGQVACKLLDYAIQGATLTDLNGDGLPELLVTGRKNSKIPHETILWNRAGVFVDDDKTELPDAAVVLTDSRWDFDVEAIDINQDGLQDLVLLGTQAPSFTGWFVQVLVNKGNREFVDETAQRIPQGQASGGINGLPLTNIPLWIEVLDFNKDGALDFFLRLGAGGAGTFQQDQPLIWLNDGTGHFSTLTVGDFVPPGREFVLGGSPHLVATRHGYSFITPRSFPGSGGLKLTGLLASKPIRTAP